MFKVLGTACGLGIEGSGWMAAPGLIVTNAHVVAGEDDTSVVTQSGATLDATPVHYDPANDLAVLQVGLDVPALRIAPTPTPGPRRRCSATPRTAHSRSHRRASARPAR